MHAGHMLIYDAIWGVRSLIAKEVWRCQGGRDMDKLYERYAVMHPDFDEEKLAAAAGDSVARCYADAVAERTTTHLAKTLRVLSALSVLQRTARRYLSDTERGVGGGFSTSRDKDGPPIGSLGIDFGDHEDESASVVVDAHVGDDGTMDAGRRGSTAAKPRAQTRADTEESRNQRRAAPRPEAPEPRRLED